MKECYLGSCVHDTVGIYIFVVTKRVTLEEPALQLAQLIILY